ncbi:hypothetical protein [Paramicrobacterium agarici]|uniref:Uncharacterized protein n=1 Tax=Paramicrobacterium agarici TaxID=630514 RepID=A0A2A9DSM0_9MICO|nr:hypothetical protein [Microbacterium agarici]PFG29155.1 hypothetical protein ATJ78_0051 [Microbacterium agarici]TQO22120.1 hypothetical protein FB385_0937 [Microbacterium agarici]
MPTLDDEATNATDSPDNNGAPPWNEIDPDFFIPEGSQRGWFSIRR